MTAYYNEFEPYAAQWLRNLIDAGLIAHGQVDSRSIVDVRPNDLAGFTQVHFFAGIGGWSLAARLAGWSDARPLWTGSCPCQPFSVAGTGKGQADERHLWPEYLRLIAARRPAVVMGEQVAAAVGKSWLDGVHSDLESIGYTARAAVVPACAVNAPHRRDRLWFVADNSGGNDGRRSSESTQRHELEPGNGSLQIALANRDDAGGRHAGTIPGTQATFVRRQEPDTLGFEPQLPGELCHMGNAESISERESNHESNSLTIGGETRRLPRRASNWDGSVLAIGADGKARRVKPGIRLLAHGVPARVGQLRAFGNAIVPQVAAEIIGAYMDCAPWPLPCPVPLPG